MRKYLPVHFSIDKDTPGTSIITSTHVSFDGMHCLNIIYRQAAPYHDASTFILYCGYSIIIIHVALLIINMTILKEFYFSLICLECAVAK